MIGKPSWASGARKPAKQPHCACKVQWGPSLQKTVIFSIDQAQFRDNSGSGSRPGVRIRRESGTKLVQDPDASEIAYTIPDTVCRTQNPAPAALKMSLSGFLLNLQVSFSP